MGKTVPNGDTLDTHLSVGVWAWKAKKKQGKAASANIWHQHGWLHPFKKKHLYFIKICEAILLDLYHEDFALIIYHMKLDRRHQNSCGSYRVMLMVCSLCRGGEIEPRECRDYRKGRTQSNVALCSIVLPAWFRASVKIWSPLTLFLTVESWARFQCSSAGLRQVAGLPSSEVTLGLMQTQEQQCQRCPLAPTDTFRTIAIIRVLVGVP